MKIASLLFACLFCSSVACGMQQNASETNIKELPYDTLSHGVFLFLDRKDLRVVRQVCKEWKELAGPIKDVVVFYHPYISLGVRGGLLSLYKRDAAKRLMEKIESTEATRRQDIRDARSLYDKIFVFDDKEAHFNHQRLHHAKYILEFLENNSGPTPAITLKEFPGDGSVLKLESVGSEREKKEVIKKIEKEFKKILPKTTGWCIVPLALDLFLTILSRLCLANMGLLSKEHPIVFSMFCCMCSGKLIRAFIYSCDSLSWRHWKDGLKALGVFLGTGSAFGELLFLSGLSLKEFFQGILQLSAEKVAGGFCGACLTTGLGAFLFLVYYPAIYYFGKDYKDDTVLKSPTKPLKTFKEKCLTRENFAGIIKYAKKHLRKGIVVVGVIALSVGAYYMC